MGLAVRLWTVTICMVCMALPLQAERAPQIEALLEALKISETVEIMQQEGHSYGDDLANQLVPDADPEMWKQVIARIYDGDKMVALIADGFEAELTQS